MLKTNGDRANLVLYYTSNKKGMECMTEKKPNSQKDIFETLLDGITVKFNPKDMTLTLHLPKSSSNDVSADQAQKSSSISKTYKAEEVTTPALSASSASIPRLIPTTDTIEKAQTQLHEHDDRKINASRTVIEETVDLDDLKTETEPIRVKIALNAYVKMALHALKYANSNIRPEKWVEVIGLMTGTVENSDTPFACIIVNDAYPIGHGNAVNAQIQDPQSHVKVYKDLKRGNMIVGWYHSHPSYGAFMSETDYGTQVRYQKMAIGGSPLTAPIALVIDPTKISTQSYGYKVFRLKEKFREWDEPRYVVLNLPKEATPEMLRTLMPLVDGKAMFLEYDHES